MPCGRGSGSGRRCAACSRAAGGTRRAERVLFALVANRALAPSSKLAAARWVNEDVLVTGLPATSDDACYRAMDWLTEITGDLERKVFDSLVTLLNLEVDVLFFDTTSTYFETEDEDEPVARDDHGMPLASGNAGSDEDGEREPQPFRTWGKSKDHRDDLPQVVIGMAVTRDGIPVRVWCWPGDTADSALIRQVKDDMRDWCLSKVIWVADRGFTSAENRRYLRKGGGSYIIGEKLRSGSADAHAALSRQGRYKDVAGNLKVKEVRIADDERFVICFNPEAAERDAAVRAKMIARLEEVDQGLRPAQQRQARRAARRHLHQARPEPLPARHPRRPAPHRRREGEGRGEPRREVPAQDRGPEAVRRGHRRRLQAAPGSRARLARHEAGHRPAPGLPPARGPHPRPRHPLLARPAPGPHRRERLPARPGPNCAASSTASTSAPSPAPPAPFSSAPSSPSHSATSSKPCKSTPRPASTS